MTSATASAPGPARSPFSFRDYRRIWSASLVANLGSLIQAVGASWLMTTLTTSPTLIALVQASATLPIMLLALLAGALADNNDRRVVMICAQAFMLANAAILSLLAWQSALTPVLLLGFTFLIGCGMAFHVPAWQASVADMVPRAAVPAAVMMNSMGYNVARSVGPALGGAIVAALGAAAAFMVNAASYLALILTLMRWRPAYPARLLPAERLDLAIRAGLRYAVMSPVLHKLLARALIFGLAAGALPALTPLVARDLLGGGPLTYGLLLGGFGLGAVTAAIASSHLRVRFSTEAIVRLASLALAVGAAGAASTRLVPLVFFAFILAGAGYVLALSTFTVTVQMTSPRWVVARAIALFQTATFGGMAFSSWLFGSVARQQGVGAALFAAAALQLVGIICGYRFRLPEVAALNLDPALRWKEPQTAVPLTTNSGPIRISIDYRIAPEDIVRFLTAMDERRRIRRRDGAGRWSLSRDLGDEMLWTERFTLPTWTEYVRHNHRRTHEDSANTDLLFGVHRGPQPPVVRRAIERQTTSLGWMGPTGPI